VASILVSLSGTTWVSDFSFGLEIGPKRQAETEPAADVHPCLPWGRSNLHYQANRQRKSFTAFEVRLTKHC
jgi:hypothetical protein